MKMKNFEEQFITNSLFCAFQTTKQTLIDKRGTGCAGIPAGRLKLPTCNLFKLVTRNRKQLPFKGNDLTIT